MNHISANLAFGRSRKNIWGYKKLQGGTLYNLKYTNMLLRYSVAAPHDLCVLPHFFVSI